MHDVFQVAEKFISINGEGRFAGELAVFIRFAGCNLNCTYCDTKWAMENVEAFAQLEKDTLLNIIKEKGEDYIKNNFTYAILEIFDIKTKDDYIIRREHHWMKVFQTKKFGMNN